MGRKRDYPNCPSCEECSGIIKNGFTNNEKQRYRCTKCGSSYIEDYDTESDKKIIEERKILNKYLAYYDYGNRHEDTYINPWFIGRIAEHMGISVKTLRRIAKKYAEEVFQYNKEQMSKYPSHKGYHLRHPGD